MKANNEGCHPANHAKESKCLLQAVELQITFREEMTRLNLCFRKGELMTSGGLEARRRPREIGWEAITTNPNGDLNQTKYIASERDWGRVEGWR